MKHYEMTLSPDNLSLVKKLLVGAKKENLYFIAKKTIMAVYFDILLSDNYDMDYFQHRLGVHLRRLICPTQYDLWYLYRSPQPTTREILMKSLFHRPDPTMGQFEHSLKEGYFYGHPVKHIWDNSPNMTRLEREIDCDYRKKQELMEKWKNSYTEDGWRIRPTLSDAWLDEYEPWFWD